MLDNTETHTGDDQSGSFRRPFIPRKRNFVRNTNVTPWTPECIGSHVDTGRQCNLCNRWHFSPLWMPV